MKRGLALLVAILCYFCTYSQEVSTSNNAPEFIVTPRFDVNPYAPIKGGYSGFDFGNSSLYTFLDGEVGNFSYSLCNHWFSSDWESTKGLYQNAFYSYECDFIDWLTLSYQVGQFGFTIGKDMHTLSDGAVNICMGNLLSEWRSAKDNGRVPHQALVDVYLREQSSISSLSIDGRNGTVQVTRGNTALDVGAIAKGYVLEKMRAYAEKEGITSLLVNFGGQVLAIGRHPDGNPWTVAIRDPRDGSELTTIEVEDAVVATSADDQRNFTVDGVTYHHIIDPATGYPARSYRSVTVILPLGHTSYSDGFSTALFIMNREKGQELISRYNGSALWLTAEGEIVEYNWPDQK